MKKILSFLLFCALSNHGVYAAKGKSNSKGSDTFLKTDKNKDGTLDRKEVTKYVNQLIESAH